MAARLSLLAEIVVMSLDTLRANKLRSALTILGVVIGVTSIVAMTALIRGFGDNMQTLIRQMGSDTVYVSKMSISSFAAGKDFWELMKRPNLVAADAQAIKELSPSAAFVTYHLGEGPGTAPQRLTYRGVSSGRMTVVGVQENWIQVNFLKMSQGRFFSDMEVQRHRQVAVLCDAPAQSLFPAMDPIGKEIRVGKDAFTVIGVIEKRPALLGSNGPNECVLVPATTYQKLYPAPRFRGYLMRFLVIGAVAREGASRDQLMREIETVLRSRHRLKLDDEDDFDILTSDSIMAVVDQLTRAVVLALVVISSIALMVGGIGVMAIMTISVTERTREIGVRKAIGAKRLEILWQFLVEAVVLTSLGGLLGMAVGAAIGIGINAWAGFPASLPWWSFALGLGFSASVGIFFGLYPAFKASKLDPIEALRYE